MQQLVERVLSVRPGLPEDEFTGCVWQYLWGVPRHIAARQQYKEGFSTHYNRCKILLLRRRQLMRLMLLLTHSAS